MNLHPYLVISSQGRYNPYIIADVTTAVTDANLNIVAVEQNALYGLNILLMIAEPISPQDSAQKARTRLLHNLQQFEHDLHVEIVTPDEMQRVVDKNLQVFTIIGRDKVGILKAISNALANFRVSIERMHHLAKGELVVLELWVDASELRDLSVLKEVIQKTCDEFGFDTIIQPDSPYRQRRRLVVFDMDNTIIEGEVIDELAKAANVGDAVNHITRRAMAGEVEFSDALRQRVALLKGLPLKVLEEVAVSMKLTSGAQEVVRTLKTMGFKLALISGGFTFFAERVKDILGFDYVFANKLEIVDGVVSGRLEGAIIDKEAKGRILTEIAAHEGLTREEVVAVGDGANDEIMLQNAGFGIAFNAYEILQKVADGRLTQNNLRGLLYCLGATEQTVRQAIEQKGVDAEKTAH
ncbi:MAG: phosphoserine phosphatase SerB [Deferribacteres bacterium]|nr:phosphoserine phosphatase SerB [candidate division KSB1 bacterium]MCB9510994.1 phosphoserine phosphatase SerB [Deferribacteres bacterium]